MADRVVNPARALVAEGLGTFFLVLLGPGAVVIDAWSGGRIGHLGISAAFALAVMAAIVAFGRVSGAHINPAVTVGLWWSGRFPARRVVPYALAQCIGASLAAWLLRLTFGDAGRLGATIPALSAGQAFVVEFLLSALLMLVVLEATEGAALAIGLTVGLCALVGGPLTGASMNPARSLGPALVGGHWTAHWIYWAAPMAGMLTAASLTKTRPPPGT